MVEINEWMLGIIGTLALTFVTGTITWLWKLENRWFQSLHVLYDSFARKDDVNELKKDLKQELKEVKDLIRANGSQGST